MSTHNLTHITEQELETTISVLDIIEGTSVDGTGLRTSIYFAGCCHMCKGCHNPESWDVTHGTPMTIRAIIKVIEENDFNVTFSGGDPLFQIQEVILLARAIKTLLNKNIWCYTGYTIEEIKNRADFSHLLEWIDVIVDGRFVEAEKDTSLHFRGSKNQRIIYLHKEQSDSIHYK